MIETRVHRSGGRVVFLGVALGGVLVAIIAALVVLLVQRGGSLEADHVERQAARNALDHVYGSIVEVEWGAKKSQRIALSFRRTAKAPREECVFVFDDPKNPTKLTMVEPIHSALNIWVQMNQ